MSEDRQAHDELAELVAAYALDAVEPGEAARVEAHLATCPQCRAELASHHDITGLLANTGGDAPTLLWDRIAAQLEPPPHDGQSPAPPPPWAGRSGPARLRARQRWRLVAVTGTAAAVAAIAVLGVQVGRLDHRVEQLATREGGQLAQAARAASADPGARQVLLASVAGGPAEARVVIVAPGTAYLFNDHLPRLPGDETYQLWSLDAGRAISVSLLGNHPSTVAFSVDPATATSFAITVEPAGGVVSPTAAPVATSAS